MIEIELLHGQDDRARVLGPFDYAQIVYDTVTTSPDGENQVAWYENGLWVDENGATYSDLIFRARI